MHFSWLKGSLQKTKCIMNYDEYKNPGHVVKKITAENKMHHELRRYSETLFQSKHQPGLQALKVTGYDLIFRHMSKPNKEQVSDAKQGNFFVSKQRSMGV